MIQKLITFYRDAAFSFEMRKESMRKWFVARAHGAHAQAWLAAISFTEASVFPFPTEIIYLPILLVGTARWVYYATLTTLSSLGGGIVGYTIGALLFSTLGDALVSLYNLEDEMAELSRRFDESAFFAVFIGAFTPVPYKIFTISAGFFSVHFLTFIVSSLLGRGLRYFALGYLFSRHRDAVNGLLYKYFNMVTFAIVIIAIVAFVVAQFV